MLKQRIITALILLPLFIALVMFAPINIFTASFAVIVYLMAQEWGKLAGFKSAAAISGFAIFVSVINLVTWYFAGNYLMWPSPSWPMAWVWDVPMIVLGAGVLAILIATVIVFGYSSLPKWWANKILMSLLGLSVLPAFFVAIVSIRAVAYMEDFHRGGWMVLTMFLLVWAADTGAYFAGKALGKNKLAPVVSPNKTWEGALGGFALSVLIVYVCVQLFEIPVENTILLIAVSAGLAIFSVIGDLFESALKRVSNIKDSGNLLPGHGGVLDRLDSTIVVAPLFYLSLVI